MISELLSDPTFQTVLIGAVMIGAVSGSLGCFAYLRKQSLIGDVVAHSSLFGVMSFFLISYWLTGTGSKSLLVLVPGAIVSGILAMTLCHFLSRSPRVRQDSAMGVMLAIFFGSGLLLLHWVQRSDPIEGRRGLEGYLFGMAASMTKDDLKMIGALGVVSMIVMISTWKELKAYTVSPLFTQSLGFRGAILEFLLTILLVVGIVIGVQCVGVILMIALLITPAAAARQWTQSLGGMVVLAGVIGATCAAIGATVSALPLGLPTGPIIVLSGILILCFSLLFAPGRGWLWTRWKRHSALLSESGIAFSGGTKPGDRR